MATIRFAGDSGDGMQLTGTQFTNTAAIVGNDISTLPDFPAEIRAPAGSLPGVSGFQLHFSNRDIRTPGDAPDVLVAMNPAALKVNLEALTAKGARQHARTNANLVAGVADALHVGPHEVFTRIEALQENLKKAERALSDANKKLALGGGGSAPASADETVNGVTYVGRAVEGISAKDVKGLVDTEKKRIGSGVVTVVLKGDDGRGTVAVGVTEDLTSKYSAGDLIKLATVALGGQGGGGRPDMAQGGGPDGAKGPEAIAAVRGGL